MFVVVERINLHVQKAKKQTLNGNNESAKVIKDKQEVQGKYLSFQKREVRK